MDIKVKLCEDKSISISGAPVVCMFTYIYNMYKEYIDINKYVRTLYIKIDMQKNLYKRIQECTIYMFLSMQRADCT